MPHLPLGTLVNVVTVVIGSLLGLLLHRSFPERFRQIQFQATGLFTLALGAQMAVKCENPLTLVFSLLLGGLLGEWLRLEERSSGLAERLNSRFAQRQPESALQPAPGPADSNAQAGASAPTRLWPSRFSEGLLTAFLIFCIGPMTIVGALDEGIRGEHSLLFTKALLDGFTSMALASTYGAGVLFSALPLLLFQAGISYLGFISRGMLSEAMIVALTSTGGVLILGLGFNLLGVARIRVMNLLPALLLAAVFASIFN